MDAFAFRAIGYFIVFAGLLGLVAYALLSCRGAQTSRDKATTAEAPSAGIREVSPSGTAL